MADTRKKIETERDIPPYVERSHDVFEIERTLYLRDRRLKNGLPEGDLENDLAGLCISGGGVRSATLGLGLFQALTKARVLKKFDYLSTVSGGGYIGSCLTSLLSGEPRRIFKKGREEPPNLRFDAGETGLDPENSPFVGLHSQYEYQPLETTKLGAKHQVHHLRRHGEYLTPNKTPFSWDINQMIGGWAAGVVINLLLFILLLATVVSLHHALFARLSDGLFVPVLREPAAAVQSWVADKRAVDPSIEPVKDFAAAYPDSVLAKMSVRQQFGAWWQHKLRAQYYLVEQAVYRQWNLVWKVMAFGAVLGLLFVIASWAFPPLIARNENNEQLYNRKAGRRYDRPGGLNMFQFISAPFIAAFNIVAYVLGPIIAYGLAIQLHENGEWGREYEYFTLLALPFFFSLGLFLTVHGLISLWAINNGPERVSGRLYRSFYTGMQGATILGLAVSLFFPLLLMLLFGGHSFAVKLALSLAPVAAAYYFTVQSLGRGGSGGLLATLVRKLQMPLLNLSIYLFTALALTVVSAVLLLMLERFLGVSYDDVARFQPDPAIFYFWLGVFVLCAALLVLLGFAANSNDLSLHYFYRDRLAETYLRTDGRVGRDKPADGDTVGPKELYDVNLRNHENLLLQDIGTGAHPGPYHLIVAALNLQGSQDLAKKTLKSDHFIFSKYFIGSRTTGYAHTQQYNKKASTRLATAMAISAAAMSSGMGLLGFAASNFYLTLFNLRTGYWIYNPWFIQRDHARRRPGLWSRLRRGVDRYRGLFPFWLSYLWRELTGRLASNTPRVYVSDGGHTGDNLGLLPLVQRQCATIVVADFEEDAGYSFSSFSQAVRQIQAQYGVSIEIDLSNLMPQKSESGTLFSPASVAVGKIHYPTDDLNVFKTGELIYIKSSISLLKDASEIDDDDPPPMLTEPAPVFVLNYFRNNPAFPHHSTADQYFDEVQFEAYRMLGEHIGRVAARKIRFQPLKETPEIRVNGQPARVAGTPPTA
jgi:hypothetical protein